MTYYAAVARESTCLWSDSTSTSAVRWRKQDERWFRCHLLLVGRSLPPPVPLLQAGQEQQVFGHPQPRYVRIGSSKQNPTVKTNASHRTSWWWIFFLGQQKLLKIRARYLTLHSMRNKQCKLADRHLFVLHSLHWGHPRDEGGSSQGIELSWVPYLISDR